MNSVVAKFVPIHFAVLSLLATAAALVLALLATSTPSLRGATAPADAFAAGRALPLLERLVGDGGPHPVGTEANVITRQLVIAELQALGLDATTQSAFACVTQFAVCGEVVNVMARLPGQVAGPAVLLTAHYDSVGAGPGVSDDLVGVATIIETARLLLADGPLRNPFILLFTDGEEVGLLGAEAFIDHGWFQDVGVVINVEARGSGGQSLMFETNVNNGWLIDAFARQAPRPVTNSLLYEIYRLLPNNTDFTIYKNEGLNGLNFAYADNVAHYHTPLDDLAHLELGSFQHQGDNVLAAARALGAIDLTDPPEGNSIYMDLLPGSVLRAPQSWATPLAAACLLAWFLMAAVLIRRRTLSPGRVLLGILTALLALIVAAALGFGVTWAVQALSGLPQPWYASPVPVRVAVWLAVLFGTVATASLFSRRLGFWGLAIGAWLLWALLTLATAVALPGGSIVFLVPTVSATVLFALALAFGRGHASGNSVSNVVAIAAILATSASAYVWLPFALTVEIVAGMTLSEAVAFCLGLSFITLTPLLVPLSGPTSAPGPNENRTRQLSLRGALLFTSIVGVVIAGFLALRAPVFTDLRPQRFSIWHVQEASEVEPVGASWLLIRDPDGPLPTTFDALGDFASTTAITLPTGFDWFLYAEAPLRSVNPPEIELLSDESRGSTRALGLRLIAGDDQDWLTLSIPRGAGPTRLVLPESGYEFQLVGDDSPPTGLATFNCHGSACDGLEVELHLERQSGLDLNILAHSYGLPASGAALLAARPSTAVTSQEGDVSVVFSSLTIP